jgi:DeoR family fructose operon transcriptional repressor
LADASKFGHSSFAEIVSLKHVEVLVTDEPPPEDVGEALAEAQVELVLATS